MKRGMKLTPEQRIISLLCVVTSVLILIVVMVDRWNHATT